MQQISYSYLSLSDTSNILINKKNKSKIVFCLLWHSVARNESISLSTHDFKQNVIQEKLKVDLS